jgi:hypothetical protein
MLKQPDKRNLNKEEFINFLKEQNQINEYINKAINFPNNIGEYEFIANVVIIPLGGDNTIINYSINYVNNDNHTLYKKMIFNNVGESLGYVNTMLLKYIK